MPSPADHPTSLTDVLAGWVHGWAISRSTPPPVALPDGYRIDVGQPGHLVRYVLPAPQQNLIDQLHEPGTWLKTAGNPPTLSPRWTLEPPEYLMATPLNQVERPATSPPAAARVMRDGRLIQLPVEIDGVAAARGQVAVWGKYATFDQIVTEPAYRRRGLGSMVMQELSAAAITQGARYGVLVATEAGRALYTRLGWDLISTLTVAWIRP